MSSPELTPNQIRLLVERIPVAEKNVISPNFLVNNSENRKIKPAIKQINQKILDFVKKKKILDP
jgi:hypothetical protein